jgi:hypothetical protein
VALLGLREDNEDLVLGEIEVVRTEEVREYGVDSGHSEEPGTPDPLLVSV